MVGTHGHTRQTWRFTVFALCLEESRDTQLLGFPRSICLSRLGSRFRTCLKLLHTFTSLLLVIRESEQLDVPSVLGTHIPKETKKVI